MLIEPFQDMFDNQQEAIKLTLSNGLHAVDPNKFRSVKVVLNVSLALSYLSKQVSLVVVMNQWEALTRVESSKETLTKESVRNAHFTSF